MTNKRYRLSLQDNVEFVINVPYPELIKLFGTASIGLHTMVDEHFGITAVEFMVSFQSSQSHSLS